jgi:aspartyl-tRNA(Asn)/glutamyl-tRNA(Gln) amidotransferase subunit C
MKIDDQLIEKLADLSKLSLNDKSKAKMKSDMEKMLVFIEKLNELDTADVDPLIYVNRREHVLRADVEKTTTTQEEALRNAPDKDSDYIKVPKVLRS